jgi:outer membrane protein TolC
MKAFCKTTMHKLTFSNNLFSFKAPVALAKFCLIVAIALYTSLEAKSQDILEQPSFEAFKQILYSEDYLSKKLTSSLFSKTLEPNDIETAVDLHYPALKVTNLDRELAKAEIQSAQSSFIPRFGQRSLIEDYRDENGKNKSGFTFAGEITWQSPFAVELLGTVRSTSLNRLSSDGLTYYENKNIFDFDSIKKSKLDGFNQDEISLGLRLPLLKNLFMDSYRAKLKKAKLQSGNAEAGILNKRAEIMNKAQKKYWDWVAAGANLRVMQKLLDLAVVRIEGIQERVKEGASPPIDLTEAESQINSRRETLAKSQRDFEKESIALSIYLWMNESNIYTPQVINLPLSIPEPVQLQPTLVAKHMTAALKNRPELSLISLDKQSEEINLRLARNDLLPKLDLEVLPTQSLNTFDNGTNWRGALVLDVPFYPLKAKSDILKAKTKIEKNSQYLKLQEAQIKNEITDSLSYLETSRQRVIHSREALEKLKQLSDAERTRIKYGGSNLFLLNQRESSEAQAETKLIESLSDHQKALVEYKTAIGEWSIPEFDSSWLEGLSQNKP